jgi:hypothetical protein
MSHTANKATLRAFTFTEWMVINRALCWARLELNGVKAGETRRERRERIGEAIVVLNEYREMPQ